MAFVKDLEKQPGAIQRRIDAAKNLPKKTTVLPPDFPTSVSDQPMEAKHVESVEELLPPTEDALLSGTKIPVTIRLDAEVVEFFKKGGKGWQPRMNAVLREYVEAN